MIRTIKKGGHYSSPLSFKLHTGVDKLSYIVKFTDSCRYDLGNDNQLDWNKLFGVSVGYHKNNSIRLAWRYNKETELIEIAKYSYFEGTRYMSTEIGELEINTETILTLNIPELWKKKWGYYLNPYFGGNEVAPHDIKIHIKQIH
jgi:hypothetical protein